MLAKQYTSHNSLRDLSQKTEKKTRKTAKKKLREIVPIFAIFCHISQQKMIHIQNCPYLLINN